ncbi:MAG TPA: homoserine O-succinyltransferase [Caulobacteraceae bacterium]|nr:homoserine O-succinyltransferase [Caulobacteraceae bacterium]
MSGAGARRRAGAPLVIGLVNNMPDGALQATERQFEQLLHAAAPVGGVSLRYLSLPEVPRGEHARAHMRGRYAHIDRLPAAGLDGLIVTGAEPHTARLDEEPYWASLAKVVDWSVDAQTPVVWSCLAAHAAVLRLDGIERRRLAEKRTGVFQCMPARPHPLLLGAPHPILAPHSRLNELAEGDLAVAGYEVLTRSPEAGVDAFVKPGPALTLFFQGHPEYAPETLQREYLRDVGRYLRGERDAHPAIPHGYFDPATEAALQALADRGRGGRSAERLADYARAAMAASPKATWLPWAVSVYRMWLRHAAERKTGAAPLAAGAGAP